MSHWEKQWRDKLNAYTEPQTERDEALWAAISSQLHQGKPKLQKPFPIWWVGLSGIAATLLLIFLLGRYKSAEEVQVQQGIGPLLAEVYREERPSIAEENSMPIVPQVLAQSQGGNLPIQVAKTLIPTAESTSDPHPLMEQSAVGTPDTIPAEELVSETSSKSSGDTESVHSNSLPTTSPFPSIQKQIRRSTSSRLTARVYYGGSSVTSNQYSGVGNYYYSLDASPVQCSAGERLFGLSEKVDPSRVRDATINTLNQATETEVVTRQGIPLRVGLSLTYEVWRNLLVESGIVYTRQSTHVRKGSERFFTERSYEEQLIGIPLALKYRFAELNKWSFYGKGGVLLEKLVASSSHKSFGIDSDVKTEEVSDDGRKLPSWLWSTRVALGVEYQITSRIGLYAEPGVSYRFNRIEHTDVKQNPNPFMLDGQVGISLNF